eukprot:scaffold45218_cov61-Phaeocystis_antarctica.AAC.5
MLRPHILPSGAQSTCANTWRGSERGTNGIYPDLTRSAVGSSRCAHGTKTRSRPRWYSGNHGKLTDMSSTDMFSGQGSADWVVDVGLPVNPRNPSVVLCSRRTACPTLHSHGGNWGTTSGP